MTVEELLDEIEEMVEKAFSVPLSGGRCIIDGENLMTIVEDLRLNMPKEFRQAKAIVSDRLEIINEAKRESESIVRTAEERARIMTSQEEIVHLAQAKANDMVTMAQAKCREMKKVANDYVEDLMKRTDDTLVNNLAELRKARQSLRTPNKSNEE
jgi:hypothetical protein